MRDFKLRRRFNKFVKDGGAGGGGAGGGVMRVKFNEDGTALDKTWQEISDCFANGGYAYVWENGAGVTTITPILSMGYEGTTYWVAISGVGTERELACSSPDGYPSMEGGGEDTDS